MKGKISNKKIKEVITEYIKRMYECFEDYGYCPLKLATSLIDCPRCGHLAIYFNEQGKEKKWRCGAGCGFAFPKNLIPPNPKEVEGFLKRKKAEKERKERKRIDKFIDKFFKN